MRVFQDDELARMQATQESAMMDTCVILTPEETADDYGQLIPEWDEEEDEVSCGLDMTGGQTTGSDGLVTLVWDATLRLPLETSVSMACRVQVTARFGEELDAALEYKIQSIEQGPSGLFLRLKKTEPTA